MSIIVTGVNEESQGLKVHVEIKVIWKYANFNVRKCITNPGNLQSQFDLKEDVIDEKSAYSSVLRYKSNIQKFI